MHDQDSVDPYVDPRTGVFVNLLGITDANRLAAADVDFAYRRTVELFSRPALGRFDLAHLRAIHRHLFGDVYPWAGELRTVNIGKGDTDFAPLQFMERYAVSIFANLAKEGHLKRLNADAFAQRAAHYLAEINAIHPFREGNGRTQREFMRQLARHAGFALSWQNLSQEDMIAASITGMNDDLDPLQSVLRARLG